MARGRWLGPGCERAPPRPRASNLQSMGEALTKSVLRSVGSRLGREIIRGVLKKFDDPNLIGNPDLLGVQTIAAGDVTYRVIAECRRWCSIRTGGRNVFPVSCASSYVRRKPSVLLRAKSLRMLRRPMSSARRRNSRSICCAAFIAACARKSARRKRSFCRTYNQCQGTPGLNW